MTRKERMEEQFSICCRDIALSKNEEDQTYLMDHLYWLYKEAVNLYGWEFAEEMKEKYSERYY